MNYSNPYKVARILGICLSIAWIATGVYLWAAGESISPPMAGLLCMLFGSCNFVDALSYSAHWEIDPLERKATCSVCHSEFPIAVIEASRYCPQCGAKMHGVYEEISDEEGML